MSWGHRLKRLKANRQSEEIINSKISEKLATNLTENFLNKGVTTSIERLEEMEKEENCIALKFQVVNYDLIQILVSTEGND